MIASEKPNAFVQLDFYKGAYGPTLRINIPSRELLEKVKDVFRGLAQGRMIEMHLAKAEFVFAGNVNGLDLVLEKQQGSKTLNLQKGTKFIWRNAAEGWQRCVGLLDGFREQHGHQYLTTERIDDALVEVAFLER